MTTIDYRRLIHFCFDSDDPLNRTNDELYAEMRLTLRAFAKEHHPDRVGVVTPDSQLASDLIDDFQHADPKRLFRRFDRARGRAVDRAEAREAEQTARRVRARADAHIAEVFATGPAPNTSPAHVWTLTDEDPNAPDAPVELLLRGRAVSRPNLWPTLTQTHALGVLVLGADTGLRRFLTAARLKAVDDSDWAVRLFAEGFDPAFDGAELVRAMRWELPTPERLNRTRAVGRRVYLVSAATADGPWHIGGEVMTIRATDGPATPPHGARTS